MHDITGRADFEETWLSEMPFRLGSFDAEDSGKSFKFIVDTIQELIEKGKKAVSVDANTKKIQAAHRLYYWKEFNDRIVLGIILEKHAQGLVVTLVGKDPNYRGKPPYASDLYTLILKDKKNNLRLFSDDILGDEGFGIWKRLFQQGNKVSVYDRTAPGKTFTTLNSVDDMNKYFGDSFPIDTDFSKYQFVLSHSESALSEVRTYFTLRRYRELIPGLL